MLNHRFVERANLFDTFRVGSLAAESGRYNLVCYGHDHTAHEEWVGDTLLLIPDEVMGLNSRSTIALYNTKSKQLAFVEL